MASEETKRAEFMSVINQRAGVYILSPKDLPDDAQERFLVKIGKATTSQKIHQGLLSRLDTYLLYYPEGFNVFGVIMTQNNQDANDIEREILTYLSSKNYAFHQHNEYTSEIPHSHTSEWFWLNRVNIMSVLMAYSETAQVMVYDPPFTFDYNEKRIVPRYGHISPLTRRDMEAAMLAQDYSPPDTFKKAGRNDERKDDRSDTYGDTKLKIDFGRFED